MYQPTPAERPGLAILPQPASVKQGEGYFQLTPDTIVAADNQTQAVGAQLAEALTPALGFTLHQLTDAPSGLPAISLGIDSGLAHLGKEGYTLTVTTQQIRLRSADPAGIFYATQTLRQLLPVEIFSSTPIKRDWSIPAVTIEDSPRYQWRGLMLDTSRHFFPKEELLKFVDLLALHKMNILHLHLTDDQGWRIEIKKYPRLTEIGSQRKETVVGHASRSKVYDGQPHGGFYTQDDLREVVAYAAARQVNILPEIELPGHAQAAIASYPEFGSTSERAEVATTWGILPYLYSPSEETFQFLQDIFTEVLEIFPSPYIHIGGDEAIKNQWKANPQIQGRIKELGLKDEHELQSWFVGRIGQFLEQHGRHLIGWDEILEGGLPAGARVMSWRGISGGIAAAQAGHDVVMSPTTHLYLDYYQSNDPTEPFGIGGYLPLEQVYSYNPHPDELTEEQAQHILGTQCNLWTEYIPTSSHLEYMAFPRAIALAEIAWTPQAQQNFTSFCQRLAQHEARLSSLQINFRPVARLALEPTFPARQER